jgi:acyl-CoA thioesterase
VEARDVTEGLPAPEFAAAHGMWAKDSASAALGMELVSLGRGVAEVSMCVRADMVNGHGMCHGGLIASLADSAFALACNSHGAVTVAAGFEIELLEPGRLGDHLIATAVERIRRGRSGVYDVTVRCGETIVAEFRGRSRTLRNQLADE